MTTRSQDQEYVVIVGAGLNGLMCGIEALKRRPGRRVDVVAQAFLTDPPPTSWTTGLSESISPDHDPVCLRNSGSNLEQKTFDAVFEEASSSNVHPYLHRFPHAEYFAVAGAVDGSRRLSLGDFEELPKVDLMEGAHHGATFTSVSTNFPLLARRVQQDFLAGGGRLIRGTVRHVKELVEGGVSSFQRVQPEPTLRSPSAVMICVGLGARFLGGVEDQNMRSARIHVLRLRAPSMKHGRALYDDDQVPFFFAVPLGNGDVVIGGGLENDVWMPAHDPKAIDALLEKARIFCRDLVPEDIINEEHFDMRSLLIWQGADTFGLRPDGPRLEVDVLRATGVPRDVPVVLNYGYGPAEFRTYREVAIMAVNLLDAAVDQAQDAAMEGQGRT